MNQMHEQHAEPAVAVHDQQKPIMIECPVCGSLENFRKTYTSGWPRARCGLCLGWNFVKQEEAAIYAALVAMGAWSRRRGLTK